VVPPNSKAISGALYPALAQKPTVAHVRKLSKALHLMKWRLEEASTRDFDSQNPPSWKVFAGGVPEGFGEKEGGSGGRR
jgi:hypothetical protein